MGVCFEAHGPDRTGPGRAGPALDLSSRTLRIFLAILRRDSSSTAVNRGDATLRSSSSSVSSSLSWYISFYAVGAGLGQA